MKSSESGIDVYLNQRFDLIPNLVECVKGYTSHEKELLENITKQRTDYSQNKNLKEASKLNNNLNKVMVVAENYPELKASEQFLNLQNNLVKMENQLQAARRLYNIEVTSLNTTIHSFPSSLIAKSFKFETEKLFEIEDLNARENIEIEMN